jgi:hypothetical protein
MRIDDSLDRRFQASEILRASLQTPQHLGARFQFQMEDVVQSLKSRVDRLVEWAFRVDAMYDIYGLT